MTNLFLFGAIVSLAIQANAVNLLESHNGNTYYIESECKVSWTDARSLCESKNMSLVAIDSFFKHDEINEMLTDHFTSDPIVSLRLWTSGNDITHEGIYEWATKDSEVEFTNWAKGQPDDYENEEDCIELNGYFQWNDAPCHLELGYICEGNTEVQSHRQALSVAVGKKQQELDDLKDSFKKQLEDKNIKIDNLAVAFHREARRVAEKELELDDLKNSLEKQLEDKNKEIDNFRKTCESKVLSQIDKKIYELRSQRYQDLEELKKINESPRILELTNTNKSLEDERNIVPQDKKNVNLWTLINRHHDHNRNLLRQDKDHELEAPQKGCVSKKLAELAIVKKPQEGDENLLR